MSEIIRHPLGVHLGQSHETYLQDCGLGYSSMNQLVRSPVEWWWSSPWNPLRPAEKPKAAYERGTALHTAFLDGMIVYEQTYVLQPDEYPDAKTGELKPWHNGANFCKEWTAEVALRGQKVISPEDDAAIRLAHRMVFQTQQAMDVDGEKVRLADAFENCLSEVSVFWEDADGIPMRARFDMLLPNLSGDLKSITDWKKGDFKESLLREIIIRGYLTQAVHYDDARRELQKAVAEGRIFGGTPAQLELLHEIAEATAWGWAFAFCKLDGAPQTRCILIDREGAQYKLAEQRRAEALAMFVYHREFFGMDQMWVDPDIVWEPSHDAWPSWSVNE